MTTLELSDLLTEIRQCELCQDVLALGPRPVVSAAASARIMIIGQAPGRRVHETGIPWNDPSGDRLREWLGVERDIFYDASRIAIMPMGFCYPGKGESGDLPPAPACAPLWHRQLLEKLPNIKLTLLIGNYAQKYYLGEKKLTLTQTVAAWEDYLPAIFPLVHPSPRNTHWLQKNPWFTTQLLPVLRRKVAENLK